MNYNYDLKYNCSKFLDVRNLKEQVKKALCYQKLVWPFTVWLNCSSDLKNVSNSRSSALNFKIFSQSLDYFLSQKIKPILGTKYHYKPDLTFFLFFSLSFLFNQLLKLVKHANFNGNERVCGVFKFNISFSYHSFYPLWEGRCCP